MLVEQADGTTMSEERLAELASSSIEAAKRRHDAAVMADFMAAQNNGKAFTTEEGLNLFRLQRSQEIQNRKKELLFYQGKTTSLEDNSDCLLRGHPAIPLQLVQQVWLPPYFCHAPSERLAGAGSSCALGTWNLVLPHCSDTDSQRKTAKS